jgi:hypothetical protein
MRRSVAESFRRGALSAGRPAAVKGPVTLFSGSRRVARRAFRHHDVQAQVHKAEGDLAPFVLNGGKFAGHFPQSRFAVHGITPFVFLNIG